MVLRFSFPFVYFRDSFSPSDRRNSTVPQWPSHAATMRGVRPCLSLRFTSQPCCIRSLATCRDREMVRHKAWKAGGKGRGHRSYSYLLPAQHCVSDTTNQGWVSIEINRFMMYLIPWGPPVLDTDQQCPGGLHDSAIKYQGREMKSRDVILTNRDNILKATSGRK